MPEEVRQVAHIDSPRFASIVSLLAMRVDCTHIYGLCVGRICPDHDGLFPRLFLIELSCSLALHHFKVLQTPICPVCHQ